MTSQPASAYVTALDGGDPAKAAEYRDEVFSWAAPFDQAAVSLVKLPLRLAQAIWGDAQRTIVYESWYDTHRIAQSAAQPATTAMKLHA